MIIATKNNEIRKDNIVFKIIENLAVALRGWGILFCSLILAFKYLASGTSNGGFYPWVALFTLSAPILALLFTIFIGKENDENRIMLATLGVVLFASGVGIFLGVGALAINLIMGIFTGILFSGKKKLNNILITLEAPAMAIILLIASAGMSKPSLWVLVVFLVYLLCRFVLIFGVLGLFSGAFFEDKSIRPYNFGRGLISQDAFSVALAFYLGEFLPNYKGQILFCALMSMIIFEYIGFRFSQNIIIDSDEVIDSPTFSREVN